MSPLESLFHRALDLPADRRARFLAENTADEPTLRAEVEQLLRAHGSAGDFLDGSHALGEVAAALWQAHMPQRIGAYSIERRLGAGGMGVVYEAVGPHGRKVALKVLGGLQAPDPVDVTRLEREARTLLELNHPAIVTIHDVGADGPLHYIVSELVEGVTLRELMREDRLPLVRAIDVAIEVGEALEAAHRHGVVHRDIKPENVMVRPDGRVKLLDFGIAKRVRAFSVDAGKNVADTATHEGVLVGTLAYMSPEQLRGGEVDTPTDVWSFGVLLYEMLARRRPFEGGNKADVLAAILSHEPPPLAAFLDGVPEALQAIVSRVLCKALPGRYPSVRQMVLDLRALRSDMEFLDRVARRDFPLQVDDPSIAVVRPDTGVAGRWTVSGWRWRAAAASAAIVLLLLTAVGVQRAREPAMPTRSLALQPFEGMEGDPQARRLATILTDAVSKELTQHRQLSVTVDAGTTPFRELARWLGAGGDGAADYRLEGRVASADGQHRLVVHLIREHDARRLWSHEFALASSDAGRASVARGIALRAYQRTDVDALLAETRGFTRDPVAFGHYERAFLAYGAPDIERSPVVQAEMLVNVRKAIARDPDFPEPYRLQGLLLAGQDVAAAERSVRRYLALRPTSALGHADLGAYEMAQRRFDDAERSLATARELDPNIAWPYAGSANLAMLRGKADQAVQFWQEAMALDGSVSGGRFNYVLALMATGRYADAIRECGLVIRIDAAGTRQCMVVQALAALRGGDMPAFRSRFEAAWGKFGKVAPAAFVDLLPAAGRSDTLHAIMRQWEAGTLPATAFDRARAYHALGESAEAVRWLLRSLDERTDGPAFLARYDTLWPGLREAPGYAELIARLDASPGNAGRKDLPPPRPVPQASSSSR